MTTLPVYRAPMRSRDDRVPDGVAVERARTLGVVGMGRRLGSGNTGGGAAELRLERRIERFAAASDGAAVWTRDADGLWWLGRLAGARFDDRSADARRVDLVHVRPCAWLPDPIDDAEVPVAVRRAFARGGRNWQRINAPDVAAATDRIWSARRSIHP